MENNLLVSGNTNEMIAWDIDDIITTKSISQDRDRMTEYAWENKIARSGMTYLEIQQFDNTFNLK